MGTETAGILGVDLATLHLADLVTQEDRRNAIKLEALQRMLAAHVQQKINTQTTRRIPVAEILLAGCQLEGLRNEMACLIGGHAPKLDIVLNAQHFTAVHQVTVVKAEGILSADDVRILIANPIAERQDHLLLRGTCHELLVSLHASQHKHAALQRLQEIARRAQTHSDLNDGIALLGNFPECREMIGVALLQRILNAGHSEKSRDLSPGCGNLLLPHPFFQDLGQRPILWRLLHITACALKEGNPLLLGPDALCHRKLSVTGLHLQILTRDHERNICRSRTKRHVAGGLHHIDLHVLASLGLASGEHKGRSRTQIVLVEDSQKRRKIGFLDGSLGLVRDRLQSTEHLHGSHLELPDCDRLVLLKACHHILLRLTRRKTRHIAVLLLQISHNSRSCLILHRGNLEKRLEARDSHASHTSILKTSLSVHDLGLFAVEEGIVLVPITRLELHIATQGFLRKLVSVFPCPSVNVGGP